MTIHPNASIKNEPINALVTVRCDTVIRAGRLADTLTRFLSNVRDKIDSNLYVALLRIRKKITSVEFFPYY